MPPEEAERPEAAAENREPPRQTEGGIQKTPDNARAAELPRAPVGRSRGPPQNPASAPTSPAAGARGAGWNRRREWCRARGGNARFAIRERSAGWSPANLPPTNLAPIMRDAESITVDSPGFQSGVPGCPDSTRPEGAPDGGNAENPAETVTPLPAQSRKKTARDSHTNPLAP
jgi:hypothetical protein